MHLKLAFLTQKRIESLRVLSIYFILIYFVSNIFQKTVFGFPPPPPKKKVKNFKNFYFIYLLVLADGLTICDHVFQQKTIGTSIVYNKNTLMFFTIIKMELQKKIFRKKKNTKFTKCINGLFKKCMVKTWSYHLPTLIFMQNTYKTYFRLGQKSYPKIPYKSI